MNDGQQIDRQAALALLQSFGFPDFPSVLDRVADMAVARMGGGTWRPRLSDPEKATREAERRMEAKLIKEKGGLRFVGERFEVSRDNIAPLVATHKQYEAFCKFNGIPAMGKTTFDRWLTTQGFSSFPLMTTAGSKPYKNGFTVKPDPAIDPAGIEADIPLNSTWDWDYVKVSHAARSVGLPSARVYEMIAMGLAKTEAGTGKRPLVFKPDVVAHAARFRPEPYQFPIVGDYDLWLAERTERRDQARMVHNEAYPDYCTWCGSRNENPIDETRFKNALLRKFSRAKGKGTSRFTYFGVRLKDAA